MAELERDADLAAASRRGWILRSDDEAADEPGRDGRVETGLRDLHREPEINPLYLDSGLILCGECQGSPCQYFLDMDEVCSCCDGQGFVADPDFIDGAAQGFNPRSHFGTHHRIYAKGR